MTEFWKFFGQYVLVPLVIVLVVVARDIIGWYRKRRKKLDDPFSTNDYIAMRDKALICLDRIDAGRVHVDFFHNGEKFFNAAERFKVSCVIEVTKGAEAVICDTQAQPINLYLPDALPVFGSDQEIPGMQILYITSEKCASGSIRSDRKKIFYYVTSQMRTGGLRSALEDWSVVAAAAMPIRDPDGAYLGVVVAHWLDSRFNDPATLPSNLENLRCLANAIGYDMIRDGGMDDPRLHPGQPDEVDELLRRTTTGLRKLSITDPHKQLED